MDSPLDNYDIVKIILNILKYDFNTLYNLLHVNNLIRTEILSNNTYPKLIDILTKYNISQLDNLIIDIKKNNQNIAKLNNIIKNNIKSIQLYNENKQLLSNDNFIELLKKKNEEVLIIKNNKCNITSNLILKKYNLNKKLNFILTKKNFTKLELLNNNYQRVNFNNIKLKYIVKDDNQNFNYIEYLIYNSRSKILHLPYCNYNPDSLNIHSLRLEELPDLDTNNLKYCSNCLNYLENILINYNLR